MDDMIRQMVQPLLDAFNMYQISSPALQAEVDAFKQKLTDFAEINSDFTTYYAKFAESGLQQEYTDLISKAAVASMAGGGANGAGGTDTQASAVSSGQAAEKDAALDQKGSASAAEKDAALDQKKAHTITVGEFLSQYKTAYNEVCKRGSVKGKAAYDQLFAVADRTDDMLEAQIIIEKERLLWKIVSDDALEIMEKKLEEMDPLFLATTAVLIGQIDAYKRAQSEEELEYILALKDPENIRIAGEFTILMNTAATLAKELIEFFKCKEQICAWPGDEVVMKAVSGMLVKRENIRRIVNFLDEAMGMTPADLFDDPGVAIWMLSPANKDETSRVKRTSVPENWDVLKDILYNDILADISIRDSLLRETDKIFTYLK